MYLKELKKLTVERIKEPLINYFEDFILGNILPTAEDIHRIVYNEDYFMVYTYEAERFLIEAGVFHCMDIIKDYEQNNFGEVYTDLSNPERVANVLAYIIGEEIIYNLKTIKKYEGKEVTEKIIEEIIEEIKQI